MGGGSVIISSKTLDLDGNKHCFFTNPNKYESNLIVGYLMMMMMMMMEVNILKPKATKCINHCPHEMAQSFV